MKYIAYCRKSREEKDKQILSIQAQIAELKEYAKREHLEITEFVEEEKTAKVPGREKFAEVLKKIEKQQVSGIIAWHPDRLARNSIDGGKIIYLLDTGKLKDLKFPTSWFENTPQGKFMLNIAFGQSKYYVDNLSENVKRGLRQKLRNGVYPGKAPFGYINNPKTRGIDVEPEKLRAIKKAFELFAEGNKTFTDIAFLLHKFNLKRKNSKPLHINEIRRILANRFYVGIMEYNGEYHEGTHKVAISKELFQQVQKQLEFKDRRKKRRYNFAFMGLMRCGECGATITAESHKKFYKGTNRTVEYIYYRCTKKIKPCNQPYISEPELETQFRKAIDDVALPETWAKDWYKWLDEDEKLETVSIHENIEKLQTKLKDLDIKLNKLLDCYLEGIIEPDVYKNKKNEFFEEKLKNKTKWFELARTFQKLHW
ncbi:MAG: recombinase family protein [Candidatus Blackburnbacteria bacterium]|nr:recombinase family protein [Candidatus Blackburnbacteria bacterium]